MHAGLATAASTCIHATCSAAIIMSADICCCPCMTYYAGLTSPANRHLIFIPPDVLQHSADQRTHLTCCCAVGAVASAGATAAAPTAERGAACAAWLAAAFWTLATRLRQTCRPASYALSISSTESHTCCHKRCTSLPHCTCSAFL